MPFTPVKNPKPWLVPYATTPNDILEIENWICERKARRRKPWYHECFREFIRRSNDWHIRFWVAMWNSDIGCLNGVLRRNADRYIPPELRREVLSVGVCLKCGSTKQLSIDHIKPVAGESSMPLPTLQRQEGSACLTTLNPVSPP
jgi:hypothetical protein